MKNKFFGSYKIKLILLIFSLPFFLSETYSQDYEIHFAGSGSSKVVGTVKVENLSKSTSVSLSGADILQLKSIVSGITPIEASPGNRIKVYPNPMEENCQIEFVTNSPGIVLIEISEVSGKNLLQSKNNFSSGTHIFKLDGLYSGVYILNIETVDYSASTKLICNSAKTSGQVSITQTDGNELNNNSGKNKDSGLKKGVIETVMQYTTGDLLKYIGSSGSFTTIVMDVPTSSKTITFNFVPCTDPDNKSYAVVQIGKQLWMAENLAYLPKVSPASDGSDKTQFCYVYGYNGKDITEAKATVNYQKYGVLYNWAAAMNGSVSSNLNPSGVKGICPEGWHLPSDDECTELENTVGGSSVAGKKLKSKSGWNSDDKRTDEYGFNALPAGHRYYGATFFGNGSNASFWTATKKDAVYGFSRSIDYNYEDIEHSESIEDSGFSIRCIKD